MANHIRVNNYFSFTAEDVNRIAGQYGWWGEHPEYTVEQWRDDVAEGNTRLGYWEWVLTLCG